MRIVHTSDWHIGHRLYENDRSNEFKDFTLWLIALIDEEKIDVLIVSGDIFDVPSPSNSALEIYYNFLIKLNNTYCSNVIITGGNHDSPSTLEAPKELLKHLNINIVGKLPENITDLLFEVSDKSNNKAIIAAVPFLRERDIRKTKVGETFEEKINSIRTGIANIFKQVAKNTSEFKKRDIPIIATGHLFVMGSISSNTERDIQIGNLGAVPIASLPKEIDYYAFGHIHKPQKLNELPLMYYSGSAIEISFGETKYDKKIIILDIENNNISTTEVIIPKFRKLISLRGTYKSIVEELNSINFTEENNNTTWIEINIEEDNEIPLLSTLATDFITSFNKEKNAKIIKQTIKYKNNKHDFSDIYSQTDSLDELTTKEVFIKLINSRNLPKEESEILIKYYDELIED